LTEYVLSIDPGLSTGIALLSFEEDSPAELVEGWQFTGGVAGLIGWLSEHWSNDHWDSYNDERAYPMLWTGGLYFRASEEGDYPERRVRIVTEKFTARNTRGFSYTTASLEPLRGEGALIALGLMPDYTLAEKRWRDPNYQYLVGGKDRADKKKRMHNFLNDVGMRRTGRDFPDSPTKDGADDFRSACAHGVNYLARELKHKPTFSMISEWSETHEG
jgi:hypothetical protein